MTATATPRPTVDEFITAERVHDWLLSDETIETATATYTRGAELADNEPGFIVLADFGDVRIERGSVTWTGTETCLGNSDAVCFTLPISALLDSRDAYLAECASVGEVKRNRRAAADRAAAERREADRFRTCQTLKAEFETGEAR